MKEVSALALLTMRGRVLSSVWVPGGDGFEQPSRSSIRRRIVTAALWLEDITPQRSRGTC